MGAHMLPAIRDGLLPAVIESFGGIKSHDGAMVKGEGGEGREGGWLPLERKATTPPAMVQPPARAVAWNALRKAEDMSGAGDNG